MTDVKVVGTVMKTALCYRGNSLRASATLFHCLFVDLGARRYRLVANSDRWGGRRGPSLISQD